MTPELITALTGGAVAILGIVGGGLRWIWGSLETRNQARIRELQEAAVKERHALDLERSAAVARLERTIAELRERITLLEADRDEQESLLPAIARWIGIAQDRAAAKGIDLPSPPQLTPAARHARRPRG